jgi:large repetitive protein
MAKIRLVFAFDTWSRRVASATVGAIIWAFLFVGVSIPAAAADNPSRIAVIDNSSRVRLARTTHPLVQAAADMGRLDTNFRMERMLLVLGPSDDMQQPLQTFLDSLHDKKSTGYHHWLTPAQFGEKFGPSQADMEKIKAWLEQQGFDGVKVAAGRSHIEFSGRAQLVEQAFRTQMHSYRVGEETRVANSEDISIPQAMSKIVRGVRLHNLSFTKPAMSHGFGIQRDAGGRLVPADVEPNFSSSTGNFLAPGDFARIYQLGPAYNQGIDGSGSTIGIVARSNVTLADTEIFRQIFDLRPNDPNIIVNGPDPGFNPFDTDAWEATLDTEWAGATAPGATVNVVVSASTATTDGVILSAAYIVDNNLADIMSVSFEACEQALGSENALINSLWQQAAAQGISVFVASGDQGAAGCDPNAPSPNPAQGGLAVNGLASTPFNTAVGGTQFDEGASLAFWGTNDNATKVSAVGYIPEAVWNESCDAVTCGAFFFDAGGGGVSTLYAKPSWQSLSVQGVPNDNQRDVPDVSLSAALHDSYITCISGVFTCSIASDGTLLTAFAFAGTSVSSPSFAGIMALVNQKQGGRQGLANYVLYKLAANETFANCNSSDRADPTVPAAPACVFNDITKGNNGVPGNDILTGTVPPGDVDGQLGYNALPGYDSAIGLGSVNAANLVAAWGSVIFQGSATTLTANGPTTVQHGQPISFTVNVGPLAGDGVPTGQVVLIASTTASAFSSGSAVGSGTLANGVFTGSLNSLPGGSYKVIARYSGDGTFGGSESAPVAVNLTPEDSSVALGVFDSNGLPLTSPIIGDYRSRGFVFRVAVASASGNGIPTGTVTFRDGGVPIAQVPVNNQGAVEVFNCASTTICLAVGTPSLPATPVTMV